MRGHPVQTLYEIAAVKTSPSLPAELFAGCPRQETPSLQRAGKLQVVPHTVPGSANLVMPEVEVDGLHPVIAIVDTGASRTGVQPEFATALGLPRRGLRELATLTGSLQAYTAWMEQLRLGERVALQMQVLVLRLPSTLALAADRQAGVLVGDDVLFADSPVFDLAGGELLCRGRPVTPLAELQPRGRVVTLPLVHEGHVVFVDVEVNGVTLKAMLDTGAPNTLRLNRRALERCGLPVTVAAWTARGAVAISTVEAGGKQTTNLVGTIDAFRLGPVRFDHPVVDLTGLGAEENNITDVILGAGALLPFARVGVDLQRQRLELESGPGAPVDGEVTVPSPGTFLGIVLRAPPSAAAAEGLGWPAVVEVAPNSPAARAGVRSKDLLRSVDGVSCAATPMGEVNRRLWVARGSSVLLELIGEGGDRRSVRLP